MAKLQHVHAGQPLRIPAADYNAVIDTTRAYQAGHLGTSPAGLPVAGLPGLVPVRNDSGADADRFGVLGVTGPIFAPADHLASFQAAVALVGRTPVLPDDATRFVILAEPVKAGAIGRAYLTGVCPVQVDMQAEADRAARIIDAEGTMLTSSPGGSPGSVPILWVAAGTGVQWALVRLGGASSAGFWARLTGSASLGTHRWKYAWQEVQLDGDDLVPKTDGRSGTTSTDYAINLREADHDATYAWGVNTTAADYPDGFEPRPVGGGGDTATHKYDVTVWMRAADDGSGNTKYVFEAMGSHDGSCDA